VGDVEWGGTIQQDRLRCGATISTNVVGALHRKIRMVAGDSQSPCQPMAISGRAAKVLHVLCNHGEFHCAPTAALLILLFLQLYYGRELCAVFRSLSGFCVFPVSPLNCLSIRWPWCHTQRPRRYINTGWMRFRTKIFEGEGNPRPQPLLPFPYQRLRCQV